MSVYNGLKHITRGDTSPNGKPRVYFSCCPSDFERYHASVFRDILDVQVNACIWYYDPAEGIPAGENFLSDIEQMNLFVFPVTSDFLFKENSARTIEFAYAKEHGIPVLPIMMEPDLDRAFNQICGSFQFVYAESGYRDPTAVPYREKLKNFLGSVLVDEDSAASIELAFDANMFLSYRKKDRAYAQKIMHMIHQDPVFENVGIWYDEFLTPGEDYNDEIEWAMKYCDFFVMAVTPSLLENPNYVMSTEYPEARNLNKLIMPIEAAPVDHNQIRKYYRDIDPLIPLNQLPGYLKKLYKEINYEENMAPARKYMIGQAYLYGVFAEVDRKKALDIISRTAEQGLGEAYEKLIMLYTYGCGVKIDYQKAIEWRRKYTAFLNEEAKRNKNAETLRKLVSELQELYNAAVWQADLQTAEKAYQEMADAVKQLKQYDPQMAEEYEMSIQLSKAELMQKRGMLKEAKAIFEQLYRQYWQKKDMVSQCNAAYCADHLGDMALSSGDYKSAATWFLRERNFSERLAKDTDNVILQHAPAVAYMKLGDVYNAQEKPEDARKNYLKAFDIVFQQAKELKVHAIYRTLADLYARLGDVCYNQHNVTDACKWYLQFAHVVDDLVREANAVSDRRLQVAANLRAARVAENKSQKRDVLLKARQTAEGIYNDTRQMGDYDNLAKVYGFLGDLYAEEKNTAEAKNCYAAANQIYRQLDSSVNSADIHTNLGISCLKLGQIEKDRKQKREYLNESLRIMQELYQRIGTDWYKNTIEMIQKEIKTTGFRFWN